MRKEKLKPREMIAWCYFYKSPQHVSCILLDDDDYAEDN